MSCVRFVIWAIVVPNYDFAVRLFESVPTDAYWRYFSSLLSSVANGVTSLFQHKPFTQETSRNLPLHMQQFYTNILLHSTVAIYKQQRQDTVVPPALAFAACFQIQHWGSGGLAAWGHPPVQTRHARRLEVPAKHGKSKENGWNIRLYTHASMHPQIIFFHRTRTTYIGKIIGHFHRRAPFKRRCSLHLTHNIIRCIKDSIYSTAVSKVVARPPLRVHAQEFIYLSLQTRLLLRIHGEILTRFAYTWGMVEVGQRKMNGWEWINMDKQWMQQSCM